MRQNPLLPSTTNCLFIGFVLGIFTGNHQFNFPFNAAVFMFYAPGFIRRRAFFSDQLLATGLGIFAGQAGMLFLRPVAQSVVSFINESISGYNHSS